MLYPGKMVLYRWRLGQVRAGQDESAAMITKLNPDGTANLTVYPDGTPDPLFLQRVAPQSESVTHHCWRVPEDESAMLERIAKLESQLVKRGPGRPPKTIAA